MFNLRALAIVAGSLIFVASLGQAKFKVPPLSGPVIDETGQLNGQTKERIQSLLFDFKNRDLAQIQVYIVSSLQGLPIEQASIEIVEQWKLGSKERDNGLLFLIAPNERKLRIEVGQGLEGIMPDAYTKRINDDIVVPYLRANQFSEGVLQGVVAIIKVLDGEELQSQAQPNQSRHKKGLPFWAIILIWLIILFIGRMGGGRRGRLGGGFYGGGGGFGGGFGGGGGWSGGGGGFSGGGSSSSW